MAVSNLELVLDTRERLRAFLRKGKPPVLLTRLLVLAGFIALGFAATLETPLGSFLELVPSRVRPGMWGRVGLILWCGVGVSTFVIGLTMLGVRRLFQLRGKTHDELDKTLWPPLVVGSAEMFAYVLAFAVGLQQFIGFWLALKVAGQWNAWGKGYDGRARFQMFLFGNLLCIGASLVVYATLMVFALAP